MQAISVRYVPPGNTTGARWRVRCDAFNYLVPYADEYSGEQAAWEACAVALARFDAKVQREQGYTGWRGDWIGGQAHDGSYVFVPIMGTRKSASGIDGAYRYAGEAVSK
jgi:hypothetical protein